LSVGLIGVLFGFGHAVKAAFLPSLRQGLPMVIPLYERILLGLGAFCLSFGWVLAFPMVGVLFTVAALTNSTMGRR
jgi:hypothetical protein